MRMKRAHLHEGLRIARAVEVLAVVTTVLLVISPDYPGSQAQTLARRHHVVEKTSGSGGRSSGFQLCDLKLSGPPFPHL